MTNLIEFITKSGFPLLFNRCTYWICVKIAQLIGRPVGTEVALGIFFLIVLFFLFIVRKYSIDWMYTGRASEKKRRRTFQILFLFIIISTMIASFVHLNRYKKNISNADVVITDFQDSTIDSACFGIVQSITREIQPNLKEFKIYHFEWPAFDYRDDLIFTQTENPPNPKVVIGGSCDSTEGEGEAQLNFKIFDSNTVPLDSQLNGKPIPFKNSPDARFVIKSKISVLIKTAILAIEASAIECRSDCTVAAKNYIDVYSKIPKEPANMELARFIVLKVSNIYYHINQRQEAEKILKEQILSYPNDDMSLKALGEFYAITNNFSEAQVVFSTYQKNFPGKENEIAGSFLGALFVENKYDELDKFMTLAQANFSDKELPSEYWNFAGISFIKRGNLPKAVNLFLSGLESQPSPKTEISLLGNLAEA